MITDADIKKLKTVFITKDDLDDKLDSLEESLEKKIDNKLTGRLGGLEQRLTKKLNTVINFFDRVTIDHEKRIEDLEKHTGLVKSS